MTVTHAIDLALATHPTIRSLMAQHEAAQVDVRTARQQFLPTPTVTMERVNGGGSADLSYGNQATVRSYRLQQPLYTWGRLSAGVDKARANMLGAAEAVQDSRQQIALKTLQAWSEWRLSVLRTQAQQQSVETHERLMAMLQRRVAEGASAPSELSLTRARVDQAQSQLQAYRSSQRVARSRLSQLVGREVAENESPQQEDSPIFSANGIQTRALDASAALRKIKAQQQSLDHEVRERKSDALPEIYLRVERQEARNDLPALNSTNNRIYMGLASRFGAGLSNLSMVEGMEKRRRALDAEYEAAERNLIEMVQSDVEQLAALEARLPNLQSALAASKETAQAWDRQFLAGRRSWVEVMNAVREVVQAEVELNDASVGRLAVQWRLKIYAGEVIERPATEQEAQQ